EFVCARAVRHAVVVQKVEHAQHALGLEERGDGLGECNPAAPEWLERKRRRVEMSNEPLAAANRTKLRVVARRVRTRDDAGNEGDVAGERALGGERQALAHARVVEEATAAG